MRERQRKRGRVWPGDINLTLLEATDPVSNSALLAALMPSTTSYHNLLLILSNLGYISVSILLGLRMNPLILERNNVKYI